MPRVGTLHDVVDKSGTAIQQAEQRQSGIFKDKDVASEISKLMRHSAPR